MVTGPSALMPAEEDCVIFVVSVIVSVHRDVSVTTVLHPHGAYHGVGGCGACVGDGHLQLSGIVLDDAPVGKSRGHSGWWFFHVDCETICVWGCLGESFGDCHRAVLSLNRTRLGVYVVADVQAVHHWIQAFFCKISG